MIKSTRNKKNYPKKKLFKGVEVRKIFDGAVHSDIAAYKIDFH